MAALVVGDLLIAWGAVVVCANLRNGGIDAELVALFALSFVAGLALSGFYRDRVTPRTRPSLVAALVIQSALAAMFATAIVRPLPRAILLGVPAIEALAIVISRRLLARIAPIRPRETILCGAPADIERAMAGLLVDGDPRIAVIGDVHCSLDALADSAARARLRDAEEVICVSPGADARIRLELLRIRGPRGFLLLASHADALLASRMLGWIGDQPLVEVAVSCGYGIRAIVKRAIDVAGSALLLLVSAPLWMLAAIAIWIDDRGPVLIRQERVGLGGTSFGMWKFRSMREARVTRVGALLRPYHLDEVPQLLNVLRGDMSLVGPRPERPELVTAILRDVPDFDLRTLVRPGMAGLAQVSAEYNSRAEVKLRYDVMYMCGWSVWLDLRLMVRAVSSSLAGSGL
ncbi:MAG TPA: sugar transferase [Thermoanaerobaculia bacterium]|jgi:lipopolysaccharide/colanic/teichoic acid biosynthesis glycosyltransferase